MKKLPVNARLTQEEAYIYAIVIKNYEESIYQDIFDKEYIGDDIEVMKSIANHVFRVWARQIAQIENLNPQLLYKFIKMYFLTYNFNNETGEQGGYENLFRYVLNIATPSTRDLMRIILLRA